MVMTGRITITPSTDFKALTGDERALARAGMADLAAVTAEAVAFAYLDNNDRFDYNPAKGIVQFEYQVGYEAGAKRAIFDPEAGKLILPGDIMEYHSSRINGKSEESHFESFENDRLYDADGDGQQEIGTLVKRGSITGPEEDSQLTVREIFVNPAQRSITIIEDPGPEI